MEEKILIRSEKYNIVKGLKVFVVLCVIVTVIWGISDIFYAMGWHADHEHSSYCYEYLNGSEYLDCVYSRTTPFSYAFSNFFEYNFIYTLIPTGAGILISVLIYFWLHSYELTVTDKRIFGCVAFGKRVDLPVDSVSATATITIFKGVSVSTSSGRISFLVVKNSDEIYTIINDLLIKRQQEKAATSTTVIAPASDEADQLKKYKDLLDSGVITQEEFDAKKKQLLGL